MKCMQMLSLSYTPTHARARTHTHIHTHTHTHTHTHAHAHAHTHTRARARTMGAVKGHSLSNEAAQALLDLVPQEDRHDGRWSLASTEAVVVACARHRYAKKVSVQCNCLDHDRGEHIEHLSIGCVRGPGSRRTSTLSGPDTRSGAQLA